MPTMHFTIAEGFVKATTVGQMGWFFLMAVMYITGAGLYAARIPERFFPGKFDIWVRTTRPRGCGGARARRWRSESEAEGPGAGGVWAGACPRSRRCVWAGESLTGVALFFSTTNLSVYGAENSAEELEEASASSLPQLLAIALKLLFCPHSSSLIRSSMSWWWRPPSSTSPGSPTFRSSDTAWKGAVLTTPSSDPPPWAQEELPKCF